MAGLILAVLSTLFAVVISIISLRLNRHLRYLKLFVVVYFVCTIFYTLSYYFLADQLILLFHLTPNGTGIVSYWNGVLIFTLIFHLCVDVGYATVLTGFSTNIILLTRRHGHLEISDLPVIYGINENADPVVNWRVDYLLEHRYLSVSGDKLELTKKGKTIARITILFQKIFQTGHIG